jgi:hypothetical protein
MKKLFDSYNTGLNYEGVIISKELRDIITPLVDKLVKRGYSPFEIDSMCLNVIRECISKSSKELEEYYNNKLYDTNVLKIRSMSDGEIKMAEFAFYKKNGLGHWVYEEGWEPIYPYAIYEKDNNRYWYLLFDNNKHINYEMNNV